MCCGSMPDLEKILTKVEADLAAAKLRKQYQKGRLKIIRSYKGDPTKCEFALEITKAQIRALKAKRNRLVERMYVAQGTQR